jgi:hypothetical protein
MALAIIFYFVVMAGFISIESVVPVSIPQSVNQVTVSQTSSDSLPPSRDPSVINSGVDKSNQLYSNDIHDAKKRLYILLAFSALVGMFSSKAIDKFGDIFEVLFQSKTSEAIYKQDTLKEKSDPSGQDFNDPNALG